MTATQREIARLAGVSVTTVNFVLSGRARAMKVSERTEHRVQAIAQDLGYEGNYLAQALARGRSLTLGVVTAPGNAGLLQDRFWSAILSGIDVQAHRRGQDLTLLVGHEGRSALEEGLSAVRRKRVDGLLLLGRLFGKRQDLPADLPLVAIAGSRGPACPTVEVDPAPGVEAAVEHLAELGHRRLLYLGRRGPRGPMVADRIRAFQAAGRRVGVTTQEHLLHQDISYRNDLSEQIEAYRQALEDSFRLPDGVTAVLTYNDNLGLGLYAWLMARGLRVPDDLSVIGFDNGVAAAALPAMTTIDHMLPEMGAQAVDLLLARINDADPVPTRTTIPARLVLRRSAAAPSPQRIGNDPLPAPSIPIAGNPGRTGPGSSP